MPPLELLLPLFLHSTGFFSTPSLPLYDFHRPFASLWGNSTLTFVIVNRWHFVLLLAIITDGHLLSYMHCFSVLWFF